MADTSFMRYLGKACSGHQRSSDCSDDWAWLVRVAGSTDMGPHLIAGFSHPPALDDLTVPLEALCGGRICVLLLLLILLPVPGVPRHGMLTCP